MVTLNSVTSITATAEEHVYVVACSITVSRP